MSGQLVSGPWRNQLGNNIKIESVSGIDRSNIADGWVPQPGGTDLERDVGNMVLSQKMASGSLWALLMVNR